MEPAEKKFIEDNMGDLIKFTTCNLSLISKLQQQHLLDEDEIGILEYEHRTHQSKRQYLYYILKTKKGAFQILKNVLAESHQTGALAILEEFIPNPPKESSVPLNYDTVPTIAGILSSSEVVWANWSKVAAQLELPKVSTETLLQQRMLGLKTMYDVIAETLSLWKECDPKNATIQNLVMYLRDCGLKHIAENVEHHPIFELKYGTDTTI